MTSVAVIPAGTPTATYTSIFAFYTASSPSCLASNYARCAPKIKITVDGTCQITLSSLGYSNLRPNDDGACQWTASVPIKGTKASAAVDLAMVRSPLLQAVVGAAGLTCQALHLAVATIQPVSCKRQGGPGHGKVLPLVPVC
jgi:hypothetical protein